jgi:ABC-type multidrug transport system fused ATPase/permease subunit
LITNQNLSLVRNQKADKIIYLDKGQIVAEGSFSELKAEVKDFAKAIEIMGLSTLD